MFSNHFHANCENLVQNFRISEGQKSPDPKVTATSNSEVPGKDHTFPVKFTQTKGLRITICANLGRRLCLNFWNPGHGSRKSAETHSHNLTNQHLHLVRPENPIKNYPKAEFS